MSQPNQPSGQQDMRQRLREAIGHFEHVLPGQAPIKDFVHHNTLHGFQHLSFPEALMEAEKVTGNHGYLPQQQFRRYYREGRIDRDDLIAVLDRDKSLSAKKEITEIAGRKLCYRDVYLAALVHDLKPLTACELSWQIEENNALASFRQDVPEASRERLLETAGTEGHAAAAAAIDDLWAACLEVLGLDYFILHPEEMLDLSPEQAEQMLSQLLNEEDGTQDLPMVHFLARKEAAGLLDELWGQVGPEKTLGALVQALSGRSLLDELRPYLARHLASYLDQGVAAWHNPERSNGFYTAWIKSAATEMAWLFEGLPDWHFTLESLSEDPLDAVIESLQLMGIPEQHWEHYLERLALELPGWSGMFLWRHNHPGYEGFDEYPVEMLDYLAVRLVLERVFAQRVCREEWQVEANLDVLRWYFRRRRSELYVRFVLFNERLPEYLATQVQRLLDRTPLPSSEYQQWQHMADMIWTWRQSPAADRPSGYTVYRNGWRLFLLAQYLGMSAGEVRQLDDDALAHIFSTIDCLSPNRAGFIWLQAYERHYREQIFNALVSNHRRGRWAVRTQRPAAQVVFCMDEREEAIRRHLEEMAPDVETLGAAAHFSVPNFYRGLDDEQATGLTPVVLVPSHEVREVAQPGQEALLSLHRARRALHLRIKDLFFQGTRRNLISTAALLAVAAPVALPVMVAKLVAPLATGRLSERLRRWFEHDRIATRLAVSAEQVKPDASPDNRQLGFTDLEQADRVEAFLQNIGLVSGFAPLTVIMGHGSNSQNNPHLAAYDCGACSGRHSGPNARIFAAMANRPEVRAILEERGITIPGDTWFLGAEHNTCHEGIIWYDTDLVPEPLRGRFARLREDIDAATVGSAHERCRRLASAPDAPTREQAAKHIAGRAVDFSQARPELGHATNAVAVIGRRSVSQGAFFDRRMFLISYDPNIDPDGTVLERLLLANGPVGAGINLEYYFSTVNNEQYGCGTKVMHNVTGLFGVMDGAASDLRTGLPSQMIEIHEPMRLQVIVEATTAMLTEIYMRQPPLQELIGNGWLLVSAIHPESGEISVFEPDKGFVPWQGQQAGLPEVEHSAAWYAGHCGPLAPALIRQPEVIAND